MNILTPNSKDFQPYWVRYHFFWRELWQSGFVWGFKSNFGDL